MTTNRFHWARFLALLLAILALVAALWAGLLRMGWAWPSLVPRLVISHGPLMVAGFFGTLIGVERAAALGRRWAYPAPLLSGLGSLLLLTGLPGLTGILLLTAGSAWLAAVTLFMFYRHRLFHAAVIGLGAISWLVGNLAWLFGAPIYSVVYWWAGFFIFTIAGERLELSRVIRLKRYHQTLFTIASGLLLAGLAWTLWSYAAGARLSGVGMFALAAWLMAYDLARHNLRRGGLTGYIAVCLYTAFIWLGVSGLLSMRYGGLVAGPYYDAILHSLFVGFVFGMVFGHAPIIFPAVLNLPVRYSRAYYLPLFLLNISLILRLLGDLNGMYLARQWGGLLNAVAILLFLGMIASGILRNRFTGQTI